MRVIGGVLTLNKNGAIRYQSLEVRLKTQRVSESQGERVKGKGTSSEGRDTRRFNAALVAAGLPRVLRIKIPKLASC